jgi:hypothetical protein
LTILTIRDYVGSAQATAALRHAQEEIALNDGPRFADGRTTFVAPLHGLGDPNGPGDSAKVSVWLLTESALLAVIAAVVPVRRSAAVDPLSILRAE